MSEAEDITSHPEPETVSDRTGANTLGVPPGIDGLPGIDGPPAVPVSPEAMVEVLRAITEAEERIKEARKIERKREIVLDIFIIAVLAYILKQIFF